MSERKPSLQPRPVLRPRMLTSLLAISPHATELPMVHGRGGFMRTVRVFVSSPGDAANERKRVVRVIEKFNAAFAGSVVIEPVLWEERFYSAHDGFQPQIARSADCDIVIAILHAWLGTPLPRDFAERLSPDERVADKDAYPSGTAYEILSAIAARRRGAELPDIFVFRYPLAPSVALDAPDRAEIEAQWEKLKSFAERVFVSAEGYFKGAYQTFSSTDDFFVSAVISGKSARSSAFDWAGKVVELLSERL
jgi:hypothetical protein